MITRKQWDYNGPSDTEIKEQAASIAAEEERQAALEEERLAWVKTMPSKILGLDVDGRGEICFAGSYICRIKKGQSVAEIEAIIKEAMAYI